MQSQYRLPEYATEIDDGVFDFQHYGNCVFRPKLTWDPGERDDLIAFDPSKHMDELQSGLRINPLVDASVKDDIIQIIKDYWDCFAVEGVRRTILGYEFAIDTGQCKPVCCKKPAYGPHEAKIIMPQITDLLKNEWIRLCYGAWGSMIVLAPKPHQEDIDDIDEFIWRMCISYRKLNGVTKPFQFPIPRCDDSVNILEQGVGELFTIAMDANSGYHQVKVKDEDQEKLAFFAPDNQKYTFTVMPFGPCNAPGFYTCMMLDFKKEWDALFVIRVSKLQFVDDKIVQVDGIAIFLDKKKVYYGSRTIIDDILLWCSNMKLVLLYLKCVCEVFQKYRVSFKLKKCDFLQERTEYVGYDVLSHGNSPASSKFDMINDWTLPTDGPSLHSFIGLINFYHKFAPYLEIRLKPLRKLCKKYFRKSIPFMEWTPELIQLFEDLKRCVTSSPVLARYDPNKPTFLKTDWSAEGMGWILMQPADDEESQEAIKILLETGECLFDLSPNGPRLRPVAFGSRSCTDMERKLHSFVGEVACGRWAIGQNRRFLWGCHFYWMCDCSAVKEILEYDGSISYVCRWAQELLGYHFSCIHRCNKMMIDVDSFTRRYGTSIATHCTIACHLSSSDRAKRPNSYDPSLFEMLLKKKGAGIPADSHVLTNDHILSTPPTYSTTSMVDTPLQLTTAPILVVSKSLSAEALTQPKALQAPASLIREIITINDAFSITSQWAESSNLSTCLWHNSNYFTSPDVQRLATQFDPMIQGTPTPPTALSQFHKSDKHSNITIIDWTILSRWDSINSHSHTIAQCTSSWTHSIPTLRLILIWIPCGRYQLINSESICNAIPFDLPSNWNLDTTICNATEFGDAVELRRILITISLEESFLSLLNPTTVEPKCILDAVGAVDFTDIHDKLQFPTSSLVDQGNANLYRSRPIAILKDSSQNSLNKLQSNNLVLDPMFPGIEPTSISESNAVFGCRYGIAIETPTTVKVHTISSHELISLFTESPPHFRAETLDTACVDSILRLSVPQHTKLQILNYATDTAAFAEEIYFSNFEVCETTKCYFTKGPPNLIKWDTEYDTDPCTRSILSILQCNNEKDWCKETLQDIHSSYHTPLKKGQVQIVDGKLIFFKPIFKNIKYIGLIIVPESLRRKLFSHYHASPIGGHMGEYKTLFRMRQRFYWPNMREDIKQWIKGCPYCIESNIWRKRKNELHFSWPVTAPFYIMHIDLWQPGKLITKSGTTIFLLNCMCDLTQFVVSEVVESPNASILAKAFMDHVVLTFGICSVVVVDADSKFKDVFQEMCKILKIHFWPLSRGNHKGLIVEKYHRFLNKTQTIAGNERGTHLTILQNAKLSQYAWNSAPIDNTDVVRSFAAVGREFRMFGDMSLQPTPHLNNDQNSELFNYLRQMSNDGQFATSVIQILAEERREAHRERHNNAKKKQIFKVGDAVTARITVQSNADTGTVAKLSYKTKGPFQVTAVLEADSYEVQKYGDTTSAKRKYKGTDLFLLPPAIYPIDPLDTTDCRYLNFDHVPLVDPLSKHLSIDMHNDTFFTKNGMKTLQKKKYGESNVDLEASKWHEILPTIKDLHNETNTSPPTIEADNPQQPPSQDLHQSIQNSKDKVFFIQFLPHGMMRPKWYAIQIDIESTIEANPNYLENNQYWCVFLMKHPHDNNKSDEYSRWWPDWYKYTTNKNTGELIYGQRVLIRPNVIPSSKTHVQWAELVDLSKNPETILVGPFNFAMTQNATTTKNTIDNSEWTKLQLICESRGLITPTVGNNRSIQVNTRNLRRKTTKRKTAT